MADTIPITFTNTNPQFTLKPVAPEPIDVSITPAIIVPGISSTFTWTQTIPLSVWTIPHNLNKFPSVTVVDTLDNIIYPDVSYTDSNIVQVTHGSAFAGKAYLN
jgi:hypothetical protein